MTAFVIITVVAFIVWQAEPEDEDEALDEESTPWLAVGGVIGVVVAIFLVLSLINGDTTTAETTTTTTATTDLTDRSTASIDGGLLYQQACAACHGPNLEGVEGLGNTLAPSPFIDSQSDEELLTFIRAGRALDDPDNTTNLVMPASGGRPDLNDAEMLAIINHIRKTGEPVE